MGVAALIDLLGRPACLASPAGVVLHANDGWRARVGGDAGALTQVVHPADRPEVASALQEALGSGSSADVACRIPTPAGVTAPCHLTIDPVPPGPGAAGGVLCMVVGPVVDGSTASEARLAVAVTVGRMGVWDYDIGRDTLDCDDQWHRIMGRGDGPRVTTIEELRGIVHPDDRERATAVRAPALEVIEAQEEYAIVFRIVRPDGEVRWVRSAAQVEQVDGEPTRAVGFVVDITDAKQHELELLTANQVLMGERRTLARQVLEDPLTGLANRRHLDRRLPELCASAADSGVAMAVGLIDVDHFKEFNDLYGHPAGDRALRRIAVALGSGSPTLDLVARYGGEEFAFAVVGRPDPAPVIAELFAAVAALGIEHRASPTGHLTISCGCAVAPPGARTAAVALLGAADEALYAAKEGGRDRSVVVTEDGPAAGGG